MAHIAGHSDVSGDTQAHHSRRQDKGPAGSNKTAHQTTDEAYEKEENNGQPIQVNKIRSYIMHLTFLPECVDTGLRKA